MNKSLSRTRLIAACCGLMIAYGCFLGGSQAVIAEAAADLGLDIAGMGGLVSLQFLPAIFVPVLMGGLADRIGRKPVITAFCALFGLGLLVCGSAHSPIIYAVGAFAVGSAYSVCESGCCATMSDLGPDWEVRGINLTQALLCLGAVLFPLVIRLFHLRWRATYFVCAAAYGVLLPILLGTRFPPPLAAQSEDRGAVRLLLSSGVFLCTLVSILLYVGLETGFGYFIESMIFGRFGEVPIPCVSLYWLGMALSRFVFSSIRYRSKPVLIAGFVLSASCFLLLILSRNSVLSLALCFATGFAYGPIWSTLVAEANARYPSHAGTASGLMSAGCGMGGIMFPVLTGLAARQFSLSTAFGMLSGIALTGAVLCALLPDKNRTIK